MPSVKVGHGRVLAFELGMEGRELDFSQYKRLYLWNKKRYTTFGSHIAQELSSIGHRHRA